MQEQRLLPRWQVGQRADITVEGREGTFLCQLEDINLKGLKISCAQELGAGGISLRLDLESALSLSIEALIVWRRIAEGRNIYGLYFTKIRDQDRERVYRFIQQKCSNQIYKHRWEVS